jgi:TP901 family phage tail tape measure protein
VAESLLGVAYVDIRARLTNFDSGLRTGIKSSLKASEAEFAAGGAGLNTAAKDMETGLKTRLTGFAEKSGLSDVKKEIGKAASVIGVSLGVAIPAAAVIAGVEFTKMASTFQSHMQLLVSAAGESQSAIKGMGDATLQIARVTGTSTDQLTTGLYNLEKANYRGADATHVLQIAAEGARAEGADLGTVITGLTSVMASYHIPASQAAEAMNQIIAAAGESKTSMENFSSALSTVIPIASAAHVSFAEVGGAIATLTQHGTSANEATQELSNLIKNFQAPSNVAINALQQLGINVTNFEQGLSNPSVGLIGSINAVVDAIQKHMGPAGLVAVSAFKQSQSASADLTTMLHQMSPSLADISSKFLAGTLSLTDYRKQFRGMGAEGSAQGQQFLTLAGKVSGFNDLLKAGNPAAQTFVAALKSTTGGTVGLNTILQLSGPNMAGFIDRTNKIAVAAKKGGDNIATWGAVQKSTNVIFAQLGETIKTSAISIGEKILPAISGAAGATARWFQNLGSGGSIFANLQTKFGPLAGIVNLLHTSFEFMVTFVKADLIPAAENLTHALEPLWNALKNGAKQVLNFADHALREIEHVFTAYVGPAIKDATKWLADHAKGITTVVVDFGQLAAVLLTIGVGMRLYAAAVALAGTATVGFATKITTLRILMMALSDGTLVEYLGMVTKSTIALTVAQGLYAVVTKAVIVATGLWTGAQLLLDAAMTAGGIGAFFAEAVALFKMIPLVTMVTRAWIGVQLLINAALVANPIGAVITVIALLVIGIITVMTHGKNFVNMLHDLGDMIGKVFHDIGNIVKGVVDVFVGLFTLNPGKLLKGIESIGKGLLSLPLHIVEGLGNALGSLLGIPHEVDVHFTFNSAAAKQAMGMATLEAKNMGDTIKASMKKVNDSLSTVAFQDYDKAIKDTTDSLNKQVKPLDDLNNMHSKSTITIAGTKFALNAFQAALKSSNGDVNAAVAALVNAKTNAGLYHDELVKLAHQQQTYDSVMAATSTTLHLSSDDLQKYGALMSVTANQIATGAVSQGRFQQLVGEGEYALKNTSGAVGNFVAELLKYQTSTKTAADKTDLFKASLDALAGKTPDVDVAMSNANQQVADLAGNLKNAIDPSKDLGSQLFDASGKISTAAGAANILQNGMGTLKQQLENAATAVYDQKIKTEDSTHATADATAAYQNLANNALASLQSQLGLSNTQMDALRQTIDLTPSSKQILLDTPNLAQTSLGMETLLNDIGALPTKKIISVGVNMFQIQGTNIRLNADGGVFHSFATGAENHVAQVAPGGDFRLWAEPETGGEGYIPLSPAKRQRSTLILASIAKMFGGAYLTPDELTTAGLKVFAAGGVAHSYAMGGGDLPGYVSYVNSAAGAVPAGSPGGVSGAMGSGGGGTTITVANYIYPSQGMSEASFAQRASAEFARSVRYGAPVPSSTPTATPTSNVSPGIGR